MKITTFVLLFILINICIELRAQSDTLSLCFLSDTQESLVFEKLFFPVNNGDKAQELIFTSIKQSSPRSVFHLGDMTELGFIPEEWEEIDTFINDLHAKNINFFAIPGNHEYMLFPKRGSNEFIKRFPLMKNGITKKFGTTAVIIFNSNFSELSEQEKNDEFDWFAQTLHEYENDSSITYIVAGCHHSPFTNSRIVSPSLNKSMMIKFLNAFYNSPKCILFLSGHAHTYEHFLANQKDFLVIGGGGGLSHPLYRGTDIKFKDLNNFPESERLFHYITVNIYKKHLWVDLNMCSPDFKHIITTRQLDFER